MLYRQVSDYITAVRNLLQDKVSPFRYTDQDCVDALNDCMGEISRIRPDIFLDLKYQNTLGNGDIRDGVPQLYLATAQTETVAVPSNYYMAVIWHMTGFLQLYDVSDTQDTRGAAFIERAKTMFLSLAI